MLKTLYIHPEYCAALQRAALLNENAIVNWNRGRRIVTKNWADVFRCELDGIGTVYVKRHFPQKNRLFGAFRRNLAVREYRASAILARLGVPQAEPVWAAVSVNRLGLARCGLYMMREVTNAVSLDILLDQMRHRPDDILLGKIADELVRLLERMAAGGFCHWDFKPRNLLVAQLDGDVVITPIDARSGKRMCALTRRWYRNRDRRFLLKEPLLQPLLSSRINPRKQTV